MEIASVGISSFLCSVGIGFVVVLFNNQIMRYFGSNELAIYGVAGNLFTLVQTFSYGIGNAAQSIVAENMGAGKPDRVWQTRNPGCCTGNFKAVFYVSVISSIQYLRNLLSAGCAAGKRIPDSITACIPFVLESKFTDNDFVVDNASTDGFVDGKAFLPQKV